MGTGTQAVSCLSARLSHRTHLLMRRTWSQLSYIFFLRLPITQRLDKIEWQIRNAVVVDQQLRSIGMHCQRMKKLVTRSPPHRLLRDHRWEWNQSSTLVRNRPTSSDRLLLTLSKHKLIEMSTIGETHKFAKLSHKNHTNYRVQSVAAKSW